MTEKFPKYSEQTKKAHIYMYLMCIATTKENSNLIKEEKLCTAIEALPDLLTSSFVVCSDVARQVWKPARPIMDQTEKKQIIASIMVRKELRRIKILRIVNNLHTSQLPQGKLKNTQILSGKRKPKLLILINAMQSLFSPCYLPLFTICKIKGLMS